MTTETKEHVGVLSMTEAIDTSPSDLLRDFLVDLRTEGVEVLVLDRPSTVFNGEAIDVKGRILRSLWTEGDPHAFHVEAVELIRELQTEHVVLLYDVEISALAGGHDFNVALRYGLALKVSKAEQSRREREAQHAAVFTAYVEENVRHGVVAFLHFLRDSEPPLIGKDVIGAKETWVEFLERKFGEWASSENRDVSVNLRGE